MGIVAIDKGFPNFSSCIPKFTSLPTPKVGGTRYQAHSRVSPDTLAFWTCETPRQWSRLLLGLQFPPLVQAPDTRFYTWVEWGAPYGRTVVRAQPNEHSQRAGPPSNADLISLPKEKNRWHKRVSNPRPLDPESYALQLTLSSLGNTTSWEGWTGMHVKPSVLPFAA